VSDCRKRLAAVGVDDDRLVSRCVSFQDGANLLLARVPAQRGTGAVPTRHRPDTPSSELLAQWTARFKNNEAFARRCALLEERANSNERALEEMQQRLESPSPSELARRLGDPAQEDAVAPACAPSETEVREVLEQPPPSSPREIASVVVQRALSACASYVPSEEEPLVIAPAAKPRVSVPEIALAGTGRPSLSALKSQSLRRPTLLRVSFSTLPVSPGYVLEQQSSKDRSQSDPCPESSVRDLAAAVVRRATLGSILGLERCEAASGPLDLPKVSTPRWSLTDQLIARDSFGPYVHPSPPADCKTLGRISDARGLASYLIRQSIRMSVSRADTPLSAAEVSTPTSSGRSDVL